MSVNKYSRKFTSGETLFRQGDPGDCAYFIEAGEVLVFRTLGRKREKLAVLGPGDMIGEMAVIDALPRTASAVAHKPTKVRVITPELLRGKLADADPLIRVVVELILKRYRNTVFGAASPAARKEDSGKVALGRLRRIQELEAALEEKRFLLHFQPITRLDNMSIAGFEALVRLKDARGNMISPGEFIPVMEESDLALRLGRWVLSNACTALARISHLKRAHTGDPLFMSVNLSGREFEAPDLIERLRSAIKGAGIAPGNLKLEITESALVGDLKRSVELVARCRQLGVRIAVDDFGTGYSSLNYLQQFDVDTLKIDRSFVTPIRKDPDSLNILRTIRDLARAMQMTVVAEGIEDSVQARLLSEMGVEYGQGYLFARPQAEPELAALLASPWPWGFDRRSGERRRERRRANRTPR